ncbi:unnamed protein product [Medioppia subpectinata]|uniref:Cathepsin propeptide inhibitor domain-containing protein n=1 Tax=Medioppia subpectinata TaxID=1979941 RepID=A0A7R9L720_9ACAR|nr:unnamed protein product [Medioppia subpectinata]CAG2115680.1 unnamed protein product [Medioppia subpectinata]
MTAAEAEKEEPKRRQIFADNYRTVVEHNTEADAGLHPYRLGVNEFADMTDEEFRQKYLGLLPPKPGNITTLNTVRDLKTTEIVPDSIDWREQHVVTPVKNQGSVVIENF